MSRPGRREELTTGGTGLVPWFTIRRVRGTVVVTVHGEVDLEHWSRIDCLMRDLIDGQGNLDLVVDLWDISHLERTAAPLIVDAARHARAHGGKLRVADRACRNRSWLGAGQEAER